MASGRSHFTLSAAISASSAATVTLSCLPAMFMPTVNSSIMAISFRRRQLEVIPGSVSSSCENRTCRISFVVTLPLPFFSTRTSCCASGRPAGMTIFPPALMDQGGGNEGGSRRHDHLVERSVLGPAVIAVGDLELDIGAALLAQALLRLSGELFDDFDAVHFARQLREDCGLVAQPGADLEHRVLG